jgi:hypothetical protein
MKFGKVSSHFDSSKRLKLQTLGYLTGIQTQTTPTAMKDGGC